MPAKPLNSLRREHRARRRALSAQTQAHHAEAVAKRFRASAFALRSGCVAGYLPNDGELDPLPLLEWLHATGRAIALPVVYGARLSFYTWQPDARLVRNRFGIAEPDRNTARPIDTRSIRVMLTPLVAFDSAGNRARHGRGLLRSAPRPHSRGAASLPGRSRPRLPAGDAAAASALGRAAAGCHHRASLSILCLMKERRWR